MKTKKYIFVCFLYIFLQQCAPVPQAPTAVVIRLAGEPNAIQPFLTNQLEGLQVSGHIFLPLIDYDPQTLALTPVLAAALPQDTFLPNGTSGWVLTLRPEARWSDQQPVTAEDVSFSLKLLAYKYAETDLAQEWLWVENIEIDPKNPKKLFFLGKKPSWDALYNATQLPILPAHIFDPQHDLRYFSLSAIREKTPATIKFWGEKTGQFDSLWAKKTQPLPENLVGSGPYRLQTWTPADQIVLQRVEPWWGQSLSLPLLAASPQTLVFKIVKEPQAALNLLQNGQLDVVSKLAPKAFLALQKADSASHQYHFGTAPSFSLWHIGLNCKRPILADKNVRRALAHMLDIPLIINQLAQGFAIPCATPFLPQRSYYDRDLQPRAYDLAQAQSLLKAAGWTDSNGDGFLDKNMGGHSQKLRLSYLVVAQNDMGKNIGLILQENAKKIGVEVQVIPCESGVYTERLAQRDFDMFVLGTVFDPAPDRPEGQWASWQNTAVGGNRYQFEQPQADSLIKMIEATADTSRRHAAYKALQRLIYDEQPAIFLFTPLERLVVRQRFDMAFTLRRPYYNVGQFRLK